MRLEAACIDHHLAILSRCFCQFGKNIVEDAGEYGIMEPLGGAGLNLLLQLGSNWVVSNDIGKALRCIDVVDARFQER